MSMISAKLLLSAPSDSVSRVSTLDKDKSAMSSLPGARSSMSSVVGLTAGLASAAKKQHTDNNGRSQQTFDNIFRVPALTIFLLSEDFG